MRRAPPRLAVACVLLAPALMVPCAGAPAATDAARARRVAVEPGPGHQARQTPVLRSRVHEKLAEAQSAAEAGDFAAAQRVLDALAAEQTLNSYERANVYNFHAFIYYSQQKFREAIGAYEKVLAQPDLPAAMEAGTRYSLAQLCVAVEDWKCAAQMLESWLRLVPDPAPEGRVLLAQAQYRLKEADKALRNLESAFADARRHRQEPKESWYLLQRALYYDKGDLARTAAVLEALARNWPKKDYFVQLSGIYGELKRESAQLATLEAAYLAGWLDSERELLNIAYLYLAAAAPYKAARVLERGIEAQQIAATADNLELLGLALREARENRRAIPWLERAATLSGDADAWARLAGIQLDEDASEPAVESVRKALAAGGGSRPDSARIVLGTALYNLQRYEEARVAFSEALRDERSRDTAAEWLAFLDAEIARERQLAREP